MRKKVTLSQCMIVKNEEKNIRQALSWGKGIVCEQIVVDTGSEDDTVRIAEEMGATVLHYQWNNDFSSAKNFAISQAHGRWIAFLDADEYFTKEDAAKILELLYQITYQLPKGKKLPDIVRSPLLNLGDKGEIFSTTMQDRIFRNVPYIKYKNKIHEVLCHTDGRELCSIQAEHLPIYHTGYANSVFRETDKLARNIAILETQIEEDPEDYDGWSYYGDSLLANGQHNEAEIAYRKALEHEDRLQTDARRNTSYCNLIRIILRRNESDAETQIRNLYSEFNKGSVQCPDMEYWIGVFMYKNEKYPEAVYWFELALQKLEGFRGRDVLFINGNLEMVYESLAEACHKCSDVPKAVRYITLLLRKNRFHDNALKSLLGFFEEDPGTTANQVYQFLEKIYSFQELKEKLFVLKHAKLSGYTELEEILMDTMSAEEKEWLQKRNEQEPWKLSTKEMQKLYPDIPLFNRTDFNFLALMKSIEDLSEEELLELIKQKLFTLREKSPEDYELLLKGHELLPLWGKLDPESNEYEAFDERIRILKEYREQFLWLYRKLGDYRSRQVLYGILENWVHMEKRILTIARDNGLAFFDLDLIPSCQDKVFVDIGTYDGESLKSFLYSYGTDYRQIECFDVSGETEEILSPEEMHDVMVHCGEFSDLSIDQELEMPVDFIKINVCGKAEEFLKGCEEHIRKGHPKLAICTDYGYEEIIKIPSMIESIDSSYRFYMRYYGENLIPTKYVLYAV